MASPYTSCPRGSMATHDRFCCSVPACHQSRARDAQMPLCNIYAIVQIVFARGGYITEDEARVKSRAGLRAADMLPDQNDWVAS